MGNNTEGAAPREMTAAERLAKAAEDAIAKVLAASPQARCARIIKWAGEFLDATACDEAQIAVANQVTAFARDAADFIERGDSGALDATISAFGGAVKHAASIAPPRPPLMPEGEAFRLAGWTSAEREALQTILTTAGSCGLPKGDRAVAIDAAGAFMASGLKLKRARILAAAFPWRDPDTIDDGATPSGRRGFREI